MNNRIIKFRMYDTEQKGWVMPPNHQVASSMPLVEAFDKIGKTPKVLMLGETTGRYSLMQFTGLKDKNGLEAYEGDIYTCGYKRSDGTHKYGDRNVIKDIRTFDPEDEFEIIGNIYENKDLLPSQE